MSKKIENAIKKTPFLMNVLAQNSSRELIDVVKERFEAPLPDQIIVKIQSIDSIKQKKFINGLDACRTMAELESLIDESL